MGTVHYARVRCLISKKTDILALEPLDACNATPPSLVRRKHHASFRAALFHAREDRGTAYARFPRLLRITLARRNLCVPPAPAVSSKSIRLQHETLHIRLKQLKHFKHTLATYGTYAIST